MTLSLKAEKLLNEFAKRHHKKSWKQMKEDYGDILFIQSNEENVEATLAAKQAEVEKEIPELLFSFSRDVLCEPRSSTRLCNDIEEFLKKRLLAKAVEEKE